MTVLLGCLLGLAVVLAALFGAVLLIGVATRQGVANVIRDLLAMPRVIWWVTMRRQDLHLYESVGILSLDRIVSLEDRGWTPPAVARFNQSGLGPMSDTLRVDVFTVFEPHLPALREIGPPRAKDLTNWHFWVGDAAPLAMLAGLSLTEATQMDLDGTLDPDTLAAMAALRV